MSPRQNITCKKKRHTTANTNGARITMNLIKNFPITVTIFEITFKIMTANKDAEYNPKIVWLFN